MAQAEDVTTVGGSMGMGTADIYMGFQPEHFRSPRSILILQNCNPSAEELYAGVQTLVSCTVILGPCS